MGQTRSEFGIAVDRPIFFPCLGESAVLGLLCVAIRSRTVKSLVKIEKYLAY